MAMAVLFALLFGSIWVWQFSDLMALGDRDFPGSYDKAIWAAALIVFWPVAPLAYLFYKASVGVGERGRG